MLTVARMLHLFDYQRETGSFVRKVGVKGRAAGSVLGSVRRDGYVNASVDGRQYLLHHLVWLMETGELPNGHDIDHEDRNPSNNAAANLRLATRSENNVNSKTPRSSTSGLKGASFDKRLGLWRSTIKKDGRQYYLGSFKTPEMAHGAYVQAAAKLYGEFARNTGEV